MIPKNRFIKNFLMDRVDKTHTLVVVNQEILHLKNTTFGRLTDNRTDVTLIM